MVAADINSGNWYLSEYTSIVSCPLQALTKAWRLVFRLHLSWFNKFSCQYHSLVTGWKKTLQENLHEQRSIFVLFVGLCVVTRQICCSTVTIYNLCCNCDKCHHQPTNYITFTITCYQSFFCKTIFSGMHILIFDWMPQYSTSLRQ